MTQAGSDTKYIEDQLKAGVPPMDLVRSGFPNSTVYKVKNRMEGKTGKGKNRAQAGPNGRGEPPDHTGTRVRLTQDEITLPASMFILYDMVRARHPQYDATRSEWLMDVVQTWAIDHAEELGFEFMFPEMIAAETTEEGEEPDDDESLEALDSAEGELAEQPG